MKPSFNADDRGGVTCLHDTQFWKLACMHPSPVAALAPRPSGAYQRHQSSIQWVPGGVGPTGAALGWAVGLVSPASFFIQGGCGRVCLGSGLFSSDFVVGTSQYLGY